MMIRGEFMKSTQSAEVEKSAHRLSVSLTAEQHDQLARIAEQHRVSIAWVVREAIERLLTEPAPLFRAEKRLP
jgi:predicted DNA-binding protein